VPLLLTLPEHPSSPAYFLDVLVFRSWCYVLMFCRLLFVLLYLLFWPFCCMFFFDIQILITLWYLQTLIKVQRSMFDGNDFRYYENMPLHCLSSFHCIVCHPSIVSTERNQRLKIVRGMAIDLPSLFLTDQKFIILQVLSESFCYLFCYFI
jgi:hypothetical protein